MPETNDRSAEEVLANHLRLREEKAAAEDVCRDYAEDAMLLSGRGVFRGREGVRRSAGMLKRELPGATYEYRTRLVEGEVAFLEWTAHPDGARVEDGADSFLVRDGLIVAQTIHYTVDRSTSGGGREWR
jgi:hypothetical protein